VTFRNVGTAGAGRVDPRSEIFERSEVDDRDDQIIYGGRVAVFLLSHWTDMGSAALVQLCKLLSLHNITMVHTDSSVLCDVRNMAETQESGHALVPDMGSFVEMMGRIGYVSKYIGKASKFAAKMIAAEAFRLAESDDSDDGRDTECAEVNTPSEDPRELNPQSGASERSGVDGAPNGAPIDSHASPQTDDLAPEWNCVIGDSFETDRKLARQLGAVFIKPSPRCRVDLDEETFYWDFRE
jgi:hypothetical protein